MSSPLSPLNLETIRIALNTGKSVSHAPRSTLSVDRYVTPTQIVEIENTVKLGAFAYQGQQNKPTQMKFGM